MNMGTTDQSDLDHLDARVDTFFVRGLAPTNASVVMVHNEELWIGLLVPDSEGATRMRYFTNVEAWKKKMPKTIRAWHDTIDKGMPIDRMP